MREKFSAAIITFVAFVVRFRASRFQGSFFVSDGEVTTPELKLGDMLLWNGLAVHGAGAVNAGETRKALIARWVPIDQLHLLNEEYLPVMDLAGNFGVRNGI